jgi:hypothetical protein
VHGAEHRVSIDELHIAAYALRERLRITGPKNALRLPAQVVRPRSGVR